MLRIFRFLRVMNLRSLRRHPARTVLAMITVAAGVSVVVAISIEVSSVQGALDRFGRRLAGPAPLRIIGPVTHGGIEGLVVRQVRRVDGVRAALPVVRAVTYVRSDDRTFPVLVFGVDCSIEQLVGSFGCGTPSRSWGGGPRCCRRIGAPTSGTVSSYTVVSERLAHDLGSGAVLRTNMGPLDLEGARSTPMLDDFNEGRVVFLPLPLADHVFARHGRVDTIYVLPEQGVSVDALKTAIGEKIGFLYEILDADEPPAGFNPNNELLPLLGVFALFSLGIGGLLVYQVATLSLAERRRDFAISGTLGAPPSLVGAGFLAEAGIMGVGGSALGVMGGIVVAHPLVASMSQFIEQYLGLRLTVMVEPSVVWIGLLVGIGVAASAAAVPSWRSSRISIAGEISGRDRGKEVRPATGWWRAAGRTTIGLTGVAMTWLGARGGALAGWQPPLGRLGMLTAIVGLMLAAGQLAPVVLRLCTRSGYGARSRHPSWWVAGRLAVTNLLGDPRRTSAMAVAVAIPVCTSAVLAGLLIAIHDASVGVTQVWAQGRVAVITTNFTDMGTIEAKPSPALIRRLRALPEVNGVSGVAEIAVGYRSEELVYVEAYEDPTFPFEVLAGRSASEAIANGEVVVGATLARARGLRPGSDLMLPTLHGVQSFRVGAIWADSEGGGRTVLMPLSVAERYLGDQPESLLYVEPAVGVTANELARVIREAGLAPDLEAYAPQGYAEAVSGQIGRSLAPFSTLRQGLLLVSLIAVVSTLLLVGLQRRRELATLSALGVDPGRAIRMAITEAMVCGLLGATLGTAASAPLFEALRQYAVIDIGLRLPFRFPGTAAAGYGVVAVALSGLGAVLPGWRSSRLPLAQILRDE